MFSKLYRLDRTDPLSSGPKFTEILVEWIASQRSCPSNVSVTASQKFVRKRTRDEATEATWFFIHTHSERVFGLSVSVESLSMASAAALRSGELMADFNYFLLQIANEITRKELDDMKFLCEGDDDLPRAKLEPIANPRELLNLLRKSDKIRPGEVMYLVTLLEKVGLVQLAGRVMETGKTRMTMLLFSFQLTTFVAEQGDVVMK